MEGVNARVVALSTVADSVEVAITVNMPLFLMINVVNRGEVSLDNAVSCGKYDVCVIVGTDAVGRSGIDRVGEGVASGIEDGDKIADIDGGAIKNGVAVGVPPLLLPSEGEGEGV